MATLTGKCIFRAQVNLNLSQQDKDDPVAFLKALQSMSFSRSGQPITI